MVHHKVQHILDVWKSAPTFKVPGAINNKTWRKVGDSGPETAVRIEVENSCELQYPMIKDEENRNVSRKIFTYRIMCGFTLSPTLNDLYPLEDDISRLDKFLKAFDQDFLDNHAKFYSWFSSNYHSDLKKIPNQ